MGLWQNGRAATGVCVCMCVYVRTRVLAYGGAGAYHCSVLLPWGVRAWICHLVFILFLAKTPDVTGS